jgi:uridine kinase
VLDPTLNAVLAAIHSSAHPAGIETRVIGVDECLAHALGAPVVHTDDFASWENPVNWWPELVERVLKPFAEGRPACYRPTSWGGPEKERVVIQPADFVLLEGVTATRKAFRPYLAYSIWVETPRDVRLRRGLQRDGERARADWERWMAEEDVYIEQECPQGNADLVLPGDADLWS